MTGTFINVAAVIIGSIAGLIIGKRLPPRIVSILFQAIGLFTLFLGVSMAMETQHVFLLIISLILGAVTGELMGIDKSIKHFAEYIKKLTGSSSSRFPEGMLTAFLLYCMGSMTIIGAIDEGLRDDPQLLLIKSLMDGISSVALASTMGIGVMFSALPLLLYQGGITLAAAYVSDFFSEVVVSELTATGGVLLLGLGLQILEIKSLRIINMIPSLVYTVILVYIFV
jgi:hypothetical protein